MHTSILLACCLCATVLAAMAGFPVNKAVGRRVVIEFSEPGIAEQEALLDDVAALLKTFGVRAQILVVAHRDGLSLLHNPDKVVADRIASLASRNVTFAACESTMRNKNIKKEAILASATTVDSGVAELVRRQEDGWSYLKSGR